MSKKWLLVLNLTVFILVVTLLIPFSMWASNFLNVGVINTIHFDVEDIEGNFSYQISGNQNAENNVIYNPGNIFTASYDDETEKFILQNSAGNEVADGQISIPGNGLIFSKDNTVITYTFLFVNLGDTDVKISVVSNANYENNLAKNNVATAFKYQIYFTDLDIIPSLPSFSSGIESINEKSFEETVNKKNKDTNVYSYILFTYQLVLTDLTTNSFSTAIALELNLQSILD